MGVGSGGSGENGIFFWGGRGGELGRLCDGDGRVYYVLLGGGGTGVRGNVRWGVRWEGASTDRLLERSLQIVL